MPVTNDEIYAYLVDLSANIAMQFAEVQDAQLENFITLRNILNLEVIPELNDLSANIAMQFAEVNQDFVVVNDKLDVISQQVTDVQNYLVSEINTGLVLNTEQLSRVIIQGDVIQDQINDLSANIANQFAEVNQDFVVVNDKLDVISQQVTDVQNYLVSEINTGLVLNTEQLSRVIIQGDFIQGQITDLSANLTAQNQVTDTLIIDSVIVELTELNQGLTAGFEKQTNDINTNTNTALSQYTNTINTNTNTALSQYTNTINTNTNASISTAVSILNHN